LKGPSYTASDDARPPSAWRALSATAQMETLDKAAALAAMETPSGGRQKG
jgi:hypothetical protein